MALAQASGADSIARLVAEALEIEAKARELDASSKGAQAAFFYKRAAGRLEEAVASCPSHADVPALDCHRENLVMRGVYLESLGSGAAGVGAVQLEEHLGELQPELTMTLPEGPTLVPSVAALVAPMISGATAPLTGASLQLLCALDGTAELQAFTARALAAEGRRVRPGAEGAAAAFAAHWREEAAGESNGWERFRAELVASTFVELDVDPSADKMETAVRLEKEARELEAAVRLEEAAQMYAKSVAIFEFVLKHDHRMKNPKIKEMVQSRVAELQGRLDELRAKLLHT